jgi:hypothetical protein
MSASTGDAEIGAIEQVIGALEPLDDQARSRVLEYAFKRLGIDEIGIGEKPAHASQLETPKDPPTIPQVAVTDIRSLRETKQPKSANEMAAVIGYYLAEVAPEAERKTAIGTAEIEKYFKQGQHPLPEAPGRTLINAAAAGYFDKVERGLYSLNPVGHNLVTHGLPRASSASPSRKRKSKAASKKKAKSKVNARSTNKSKRKSKK